MTHVLIIDDDPSARLVIARALGKEGYQVEQAKNGQEGIELANQLLPALIICDWNMPQITGLDVCRYVKSKESLVFTHFILLTARDEVSDLVRGLESGADDFLSKPANPSELRARVRAGLRLNRLNRELQRQKQILEEELSQAANYVRSLLPAPLKGVVSAQSCFMPSIQLGGDYFDYFWLDDNHFVVYVLDVSGHGVGAALLSVSIQNLLRSARIRDEQADRSVGGLDLSQPQQVLSKLNEYFQMSFHQEMYFTIWYGVYHRVSRHLTYACAGHPPALLIRGDEVEKIGMAGLPIGLWSDCDYEEGKIFLPPHSRLYVFSDGAYEVTPPNQSMWGIEGLAKILTGGNGVPPLEAMIDAVKGIKLDDDLSIVELYFA
ncbi:MAG: regulator [Cyanobacteria bacterium M5B4]|nr:MAG: regulator [Cyanobacteria bacterium M5B4]